MSVFTRCGVVCSRRAVAYLCERARVGVGLRVVVVSAVVGGAALVALPVLAADPFRGITDVIFGSARTWAGALLVIGLLGLGLRFMTGDPDSNVQTRNFLWGSIACIAAGLGLGVYDWVASWAGVR